MNLCVRIQMMVMVAVFALYLDAVEARAALVGYWDFDHTSGTTLSDSSGNGYDGDLEGAILPTWTSGFTGQVGDGALSFTTAGQAGSVKASTDTAPNVGSSRVDLGLTSGLRLLGNETISMWLRPDASGTRQNVFGISYSGAGSLVLEHVDAVTQVKDGFNFYYGSGGDNGGGGSAHNNGVDSTPITRDGSTWTHVVFRRDGGGDDLQPWSSSILYNGADVTTVTSTPEDVNEVVGDTAGTRVYLGAGYVTSFEGLIDDTAIWDRALSDGEANALYDARANTANPFYVEDLDVTVLEEVFQVHIDASTSFTKVGDYSYIYSADIGTLFPSLTLGEAGYFDGQIVLLLDDLGTGVIGSIIPEPSSFLLLGLGALGLVRNTRRRTWKKGLKASSSLN